MRVIIAVAALLVGGCAAVAGAVAIEAALAGQPEGAVISGLVCAAFTGFAGLFLLGLREG